MKSVLEELSMATYALTRTTVAKKRRQGTYGLYRRPPQQSAGNAYGQAKRDS